MNPRQTSTQEELATAQECLWVAENALGQIEKGAPSAYWRGLAQEALQQIAEIKDSADA